MSRKTILGEIYKLNDLKLFFPFGKKVKIKEFFEDDVLEFIIENKEELADQIDTDINKKKEAFIIAKKYLNKSKGMNYNMITYKYTNFQGLGRQFAKGPSLQSMKREIRNAITVELYDDIDIKNAHPTFLEWMCDIHGFKCSALIEYNDNREKHFERLMKKNKIKRDDAKKLFLEIINGGTSRYKRLAHKTKFLDKFIKEIAFNLSRIEGIYPNLYKFVKKKRSDFGKKFNHEGATQNIIMTTIENHVLMAICEFYKREGLIDNDCILMFDGVMIKKNKKNKKLLRRCEKFILETFNIHLTLVIKIPEDIIDI